MAEKRGLRGIWDDLMAKKEYAADYAAERHIEDGMGGMENGPADAMRHGLAAALIARDYGPTIARVVGDGRELATNPLGFFSDASTMDRRNHEVAARIGNDAQGVSDEELARRVSRAIPLGPNSTESFVFLPEDTWKNSSSYHTEPINPKRRN
jgi:hypothetical protein